MSKIDADVEETTRAKAAVNPRKRGPLFLGLMLAVAASGGAYYAYDTLYASRHAITDNAYVGADVAQITPLVAAPVTAVLVSDTEMVKKGDVLVRLDDTDARLALSLAEANYQSAIRRVTALIANDKGFVAQLAGREADRAQAAAQLSSAEANFEKARIDLDRRKTLADKGSVSGDEVTAVETALRTAEASLASAQAGAAGAAAARDAVAAAKEANAAMIVGAGIDDNPEVLAAKSARDQAQVNLDRTVMWAPVDGVISRRQVQVGQRVQPGMTLMVVVPLQDAYVDANYKEVQLAHVKAGQKVTLVSDLYGSDVPFTGTVVGFSGGTGAAFSVVPAQNATGNWIKVVQRLPVRIALDPAELAAHPLQVGLSMTADISVAE
ncbi:EmrA/EmrK family multidrug efflux transporter periplasmic adaptor subunit [Pleomorphomonas diazotrophica]|uniref:EmrA/EmrK family multidrug efflux transporter periplasmic adaptor subunit n=1 Tax=Pleomorphomonas diazotrophica TaxID=1166257 RepID=A0A2N3LZ66_9HYPH|nr:HlyD family efflux transporter periplasmic adaptor subunit [Pleomorphomonas diazotrophica]PKR89873.1 EmrA/EmrK family multidrug efflux transporter periplasmic adaptor subunit [Pleomorphomonas diazotrophica]